MSNPNGPCPNCGLTNFPGDARCRQCGTPLAAGPQAGNVGPPQGQAPSWGQAPQYGAPPSYGQQSFGGAGSTFSPDVTEAKKTARNALIAGLVGLVCLGFILGVLAIKWGNEARNSLRAAGVGDGQGMALAGIILGVLDIIGWVIVIVGRLAG